MPIPTTANPIHKALKLNSLVPPVAVSIETGSLALTARPDDLPRLLAYSATAIKQFND